MSYNNYQQNNNNYNNNNNFQGNGNYHNNNNNNNFQGNNNNNNRQSSQLTNVLSRSFPGQSLLSISLVRDDDPQRPWYKNKYYSFVAISPPIQNQNGGNSWDVKNRINMKIECDKLLGLGLALEKYILTNGNPNFQYSIYSDNSKSNFNNGQNQIKTIFISYFEKQKQSKNGQISVANYSLSASSSMNGQSSNPFGYSGTAGDMLAVAEIIKMIGQEGIKAEFEFQKSNAGVPNQLPQQSNEMHPSNYNNVPIPNNPPVGNMNPGMNQNQMTNMQQNGPFPNAPIENNPPMIPNTPADVVNNFANTLMNAANQQQQPNQPGSIPTTEMFNIPGM